MKASRCFKMSAAALAAVAVAAGAAWAQTNCLPGGSGQTTNCAWPEWIVGADGANVIATLDGSATLTIGGSGRMKDFAPVDYAGGSNAPWLVDGSVLLVKKIVIDTGITYIGSYAFFAFDYMGDLTCLAKTPPTVGEKAFGFKEINYTRLNVPEGSAAAYSAAPVWKDFSIHPIIPPKPGDVLTWPCGANGDNVTCTFSDGKFIVQGRGDMVDVYPITVIPEQPDIRPWKDYADSIRYVYVEYGVTSISGYAFFNCRNLKFLHVSRSVTSIGDYAFLGCNSLRDIYNYDMVSETPDIAVKIEKVFKDVPLDSVVLYVPDEVAAEYRLYGMADKFGDIQAAPAEVTSVAPSARVTAAKAAQFVIVRGRTLNVNAGAGSQVRIRVMTLTGRTAASFNAAGGAKVSLAKIPSGAYLIEAKRAVDGRRVTSSVVLR